MSKEPQVFTRWIDTTIEQLKIDNQELLEDNAWWSRRWKAENNRANNLQQKIDKAIEYNKEVLTWTTNEPITDEIAYKNLEILGDKE